MSFTNEIKDRFLTPWTSVFVGYLFIVIAAGCFGVAFTAYEVYKSEMILKENFKIAESLATFFIAIVATSYVDLNLCKKLQNKKAFTTWSVLVGGLCLGLLWITYQFKSNFSIIPSLIGTLIALSMWIIANADNDKIIYEDDYYANVDDKKKTLTNNDDEFQR